MSRLPVALYGDPVLRQKVEPVEEITDEIRELVQDMLDTCEAENGIGIAAPQVSSSLSVMLIVPFQETERGEFEYLEPIIFINPKLSDPADDMDIQPEGCLSIPGVRGHVTRPESITVEWMDLEGKQQKQTFHGYTARQIMHENDHLNGVLFVDRLEKKERRRMEDQLQVLKKQTQKMLKAQKSG